MLSYSYQVSKGNSSMFLEATQMQYVFGPNTLFKGDPQLVDFNGRTFYDKPYDFKAFGTVTLPFEDHPGRRVQLHRRDPVHQL